MMKVIKAYAVNNLCYKKGKKMKPQGIVLHATGANNPNLKRYVDAPDEVGINPYGNHWNVEKPSGRKVCVHAFIGYDKDKKVQVAEILPLDICCWGCGSGSSGSYNSNPAYIQIEICQDAMHNEQYYRQAFSLAVEYCRYLCKKYGLSVDNIVSHKEAHKLGYASNHGDPEYWMEKFGENMENFRKQVAAGQQSGKNPTTHNGHNNEKKETVKGDYRVKVTTDVLNIRKGPSTETKKVGKIIDKGVYTIVEDQNGAGATLWGKLKSGAGWISLDYVKRIG